MTPDDEPRAIELEIEVAGTPEEVWDGDRHRPRHHARGCTPPSSRSARAARMTYDMGGGAGGDATVRGWDPPRRYVEERRVGHRGPGAGRLLATEWTVEARAGGTCIVRMVTSGFPSGAAWDDEIEGFTEAMATALENLRLYRDHFPGEHGTWMRVYGKADGGWRDGLAALTGALGLADAQPGARVSADGTGAPPFAGTVARRAGGRLAGLRAPAARGARPRPRQRRRVG